MSFSTSEEVSMPLSLVSRGHVAISFLGYIKNFLRYIIFANFVKRNTELSVNDKVSTTNEKKVTS